MLNAGTILQNRYLIMRKLGQGGMGAVYEAIDQRFGNTVAVKETLVVGEELLAAFQREARLLNSLRHAALPVVIDYFTEGASRFLVMQFIPGDDLGALLKKRGVPFPVDEALEWADQLLAVLDYLHTHEPPIIHRDIKPQNLKLTSRGELILLDFGLAKGEVHVSVAMPPVSVYGYTPHYAPFEQIQGAGTDQRSDLYGLAATLYHLLTGVIPPDAMQRVGLLVDGSPDPLQLASEINGLIPSAVAEVLKQGMALNCEERLPSALSMIQALREARGIGRPESPRLTVTAHRSGDPLPAESHLQTVPLASERDQPPSTILIEYLPGDIHLELVPIPAGLFWMGSLDSETGRGSNEGPYHQVRVPAFHMSKYPITQAQWHAVSQFPKARMALNPRPSHFIDEALPVEQVSWEEAQEFCSRLSKKAGKPYRLASEAEWEYACRAGTVTAYWFGDQIKPDLANYRSNPAMASTNLLSMSEESAFAKDVETAAAEFLSYRAQPSVVGTVGAANPYGLWDLHGNVWEWCLDVWHPDYTGAPSNALAWESGGVDTYRVVRGGAWNVPGSHCRSAMRMLNSYRRGNNAIGFRIVLSE